MKRSTTIALIVMTVMIVLYARSRKKTNKRKLAVGQTSNNVEKFNKTNNYDGDKNIRNNGIKLYKVDWTGMTCHYLMVMDDESMSGKFSFDGPNNSGNRHGTQQTASGWTSKFSGTDTRRGKKVAIFEIQNPKKGYSERRVVNFSDKKIES